MNDRLQKISLTLLLLAALASTLLIGVLGVGRTSASVAFNQDGQILYAAGRAWLAGANPYDYADLSRSIVGVPGLYIRSMGFFYPPQAAALCVALGLLPYSAALHTWVLCNLLAALCVAVVIVSLMHRAGGAASDRSGAAVVAAVIIGSPFTSQVIWMGQTALVACAALFASWYFRRQQRPIIAGLCLALATIKPQLALPLAVWVLLERDWKTLAATAAFAIMLAAYPFMTQGAVHSVGAWRNGLLADYALPFNLPAWPHKVGLQSLLYLGGIALPNWVLLGSGLLLILLQWRYRARLDGADWLTLLMSNCCVFSPYIHDYDYVALAPLYASMWRYGRSSRLTAVCAAAALLLLFVPLRLVQALEVPLLIQWRTVVVAVLGSLVAMRSAHAVPDPAAVPVR